MNYADARSQIGSGDAMFVRGTWHFSHLIQHVTGQTWSHVGCLWRCGGRLLVIEAMEGVEVRLSFASKSLPFYWVPTHLHWTPEVEQFALDRVGEKYNLVDCARAALGLPPDGEGWQCAELYKAIAEKGGLILDCAPVPGNIAMALMKVRAMEMVVADV
jgi:hypothetical protein